MTAVDTPTGTPNRTGDVDTLLENVHRIGPLIREHSATNEKQRRVSKAVHETLAGAGFYRLLAPRSLGGLELDPVNCARIVEEIARYDSAAAWALQSGNVNAWWAARLAEDGVQELYGSDPSTLVAAAFHPPQQAIEVDGGYRVTGRSPLASMIHDSTWSLFSAFIMDGGKPRMTEFGPAMIGFLIPTRDVEIIDTWDSLGMRGTDSNDAAFRDVMVPRRRTFLLVPDFERGKHFQGPLYRYPAVPIIALFSVGVMMAAARGALDEFRELAGRKVAMGSMKTLRDRGMVQASLAEAEAALRSARAFFYGALGEAWGRTTAGQPNTMEHRAELLLAGVNAARAAATVTDTVQRLAGTTGIYTKSPLERYFRDVQTLRHHGFVSESRLESIGQVYLGLPPDFALLAF